MEPEFCMMRYEAKINDHNGRVYGFSDEESATQKIHPSVNISMIDAIKACENTPVMDEAGNIHGAMRLATLSHWQDAGDGQIGSGGTLYPWGDNPKGGVCVLDSIEGPKWKGVQPSGSQQSCVSVFGVYDQLGNVWEWVDTERTAGAESWLRALRKDSWELTLKEKRILITKGDLLALSVQSICTNLLGLQIDKTDGSLRVQLHAETNLDCRDAGKGYLMYRSKNIDGLGEMLPIYLNFDQPNSAQVLFAQERNNELVGAKVGGSFYSGSDTKLDSFWVGHVPTFNGSIGFRCEAQPFVVHQ
jgi:hypothetical protein